LSSLLLLWQWLAARRFPLHEKTPASGFAPAISILKPLKGCDETTAVSLQSWFHQSYAGPVEILFGVADAGDPVCEIVRRLMAENSGRPARLVVCENPAGANAKVAKLAQLQALAAHDLILISDADVRVSPDFLNSFVAPLRDEKNALVNCFYRLANPATTAMKWEAVAVNADFWSQVLQSRTLQPFDFALGAAILVRRHALEGIGGFAALVNCLADDFQLGRRIARNGHRIALCPVVVECWDTPQNWTQVWKHQLRWARTVRVCRPASYFFSILSNATLWPGLWLAAAASAGNFLCAALTVGCLLLLRIMLARNLQRRFTPERKSVSPFWLTPLKDLLQAALWLAAFLGDTIEWRGRKMKVNRDGTLVDA
jgi:ceramide glucosyltransferase